MSAVGRGKQVRVLNPVVAKSRRDRLGAVTLRKFSGPDNNAAYRTAKEFEERAGGREGVDAKIEALGDTAPAEMRELAKALQNVLAFLEIALSGLNEGDTIRSVTRSLIEAADLKPHLLTDSQT